MKLHLNQKAGAIITNIGFSSYFQGGDEQLVPKVPLTGSSKYPEAVFLGKSVQARTAAGTPKKRVSKHGSVSIRHPSPA